MTDRELLEAARNAAGISGGEWDGRVYVSASGNYRWAPLDDDGDALRLAVKLHLEIDHNHPLDNDEWVMALPNGKMVGSTEEVDGEISRPAATRRAIVRAAAEISREHGEGGR